MALGVDGIAAGMGTGPAGVVLAWGRQETSAGLEDAQFTLGQGPCVEALADGAPVLIADLADAGERWPAFTAADDRYSFSRTSNALLIVDVAAVACT